MTDPLASGPEPLEPHPDVGGLLACRLCGGVTPEGMTGVLAHHLPGCTWRIRAEIATRTGSEPGPAPYQPTTAPVVAGRAGPDYLCEIVGIDPDRWAQVDADLALVDQLERRLGEMTWPTPGGPDISAAQPLGQLLRAARSTILTWHQAEQHRAWTTPDRTAARPGGMG